MMHIHEFPVLPAEEWFFTFFIAASLLHWHLCLFSPPFLVAFSSFPPSKIFSLTSWMMEELAMEPFLYFRFAHAFLQRVSPLVSYHGSLCRVAFLAPPSSSGVSKKQVLDDRDVFS